MLQDITRPVGQLALWNKNLKDGLITDSGEPILAAASADRPSRPFKGQGAKPAHQNRDESASAVLPVETSEDAHRVHNTEVPREINGRRRHQGTDGDGNSH